LRQSGGSVTSETKLTTSEPGKSPDVTEAAPAKGKPRLRGVFHEVGFYAAVVVAGPAIVTTQAGTPRTVAAVFASCLVGCFGASALYHRPNWRPSVRSWLVRLDHAGVYLLIAGTYTPVAVVVMSEGWRVPVLCIVWGGAAAAILLKLFWVRAPKSVAAGIGLALGWVGIVAFGQLLKLPLPGLLLLVAGGLLYSLGAVVYARRRPDPIPHILGYHEVFHALTVGAAACQYVAVVFFVLPRT
jgi:hemolysin III